MLHLSNKKSINSQCIRLNKEIFTYINTTFYYLKVLTIANLTQIQKHDKNSVMKTSESWSRTDAFHCDIR